jgi:hypothetical protein
MPVNSGDDWAELAGSTLCVFSPTSAYAPGLPGDAAPQPIAVQGATSVIQLGGVGAVIVTDDIARLAYISMFYQQEIVVVDTAVGAIVAHIPTAAWPSALELSQDRATLYVSSSYPTALSYIDTATRTLIRTVDLSQQYPYGGVIDIIEAAPDRLFLGSGSPAPLAELRPAQNDALATVAGIPIGTAFSLAVNPAHTILYVGGNFSSSRSLYRLALSQPAAAVLPQAASFEVANNREMHLSPDGERIYLYGGRVIDSESFHPLAQLGMLTDAHLYPQKSRNLVTVVAPTAGYVRLVSYDTTTFVPVQILDTTCPASNVAKLLPVTADETSWLIFNANTVCLVTPP